MITLKALNSVLKQMFKFREKQDENINLKGKVKTKYKSEYKTNEYKTNKYKTSYFMTKQILTFCKINIFKLKR